MSPAIKPAIGGFFLLCGVGLYHGRPAFDQGPDTSPVRPASRSKASVFWLI